MTPSLYIHIVPYLLATLYIKQRSTIGTKYTHAIIYMQKKRAMQNSEYIL